MDKRASPFEYRDRGALGEDDMSMMIAALLAAGAAQAPAPATELSDARCVAAFLVMVDEGKSDDDKQAATVGAVYFAGKLYGRNPNIDLTAALRGAEDEVGNNLKAELTRCGAELTTMGTAMTTAGNALQKKP